MTTGIDKLIVALDVDDLEAAKKTVEMVYPAVKTFKVGSQLFTNAGPASVKMLTGIGCKVFLDLKFHDIPNTVANAARAAVRLGVFMLNVHVQGGFEMMRTAADAVRDEARRIGVEKPLIVGVTVLTSMGEKDLRDLEIRKGVKSQVTYLAKLAKDAGLDGVVASADEIEPVRWACGDDFVLVVPGVRPSWAARDDQKRIATPGEAVKLGARYIVVGRPILKAEKPQEAARMIIEEIA
ncbi:MAG: orotidine-5'-phosphate decarboxylase [Candidatus Omnitrophota bacterium]